ncbi:MAG TPA: response regulator [Thermomicrobiales bacterium]|nr:response regulator [Thermomicrobiales bacterium]
MEQVGVYTLLVVEDDPAILELVRESLRAEGYRVAVAADFPAAAAALGHTQFDLVLADALGAATADARANRWATLERLRDLAGSAAVVIFTAYSAVDFAGYRERGFSDLLLKPFDLDELLETVRRNLPGAGLAAPIDADAGREGAALEQSGIGQSA